MFKILAILFKEKRYLSTPEIIKATAKKQPNVLRELEKLNKAKIVLKKKRGNQNFYKINKNYSYFKSLKGLFSEYNDKSKSYTLINEESGPAFLSLNYLMKAFVSPKIKKTGFVKRTPNLISYFKGDYVWFYFEKEDFAKNAKESLKKLLLDPSFVKKTILKKSLETGSEVIRISKILKKRNYKVNKKDATKAIKKFSSVIENMIAYNYIGIQDLKFFIYSDYLKKYFTIKTKGTDLKANYVMERLLAPEHITTTQIVRMEIIDAVIKYKENKNFGYKTALKKTKNDWEWINYGYGGPVLEMEYFENIFNELGKKNTGDLKKEINDIISTSREVKKKKEEIYKKLKIDKKHKKFIEAISLLSYLKIYRKDITFLIIYLTYKILGNFNKDLGKDDLKYLSYQEALDLINGRLKTDRKTLIERERQSVYLSKEDKILYGKKAEKFIEKNVEEDEMETSGEGIKLLEGTTACLGKTGDWIFGEVKIINRPDDVGKMERGNVLVSTATTPELLPAMKKASAIVTDHGGITSHAAIVSRELNVPCVIGVKYGTQVFKDKDKVVVCPRHGYIRFQ